MKFAANLSFMFQEAGGLLNRYEAAAKAGFRYVECAFPYSENVDQLKSVKEKYNLEQVLINLPLNESTPREEKGIGCLPDKVEEFRSYISQAILYAKALKCPRIHVMAGKVDPNVAFEKLEKTYLENLQYACSEFKKENLTCVIEPINPITMPTYFLNSYDQGHIQIAQVPDRHEPDSDGEINYKYIFDLLSDLKYDLYIGCEYLPAKDTLSGLGWIKKYNASIA